MEFLDQNIDDIVDSLSPLLAESMDETAKKVINRLQQIPNKQQYGRNDVADLLDSSFKEGILCCRLFLGLSKDNMEQELRLRLQKKGIGIKSYTKNRELFLEALDDLRLIDAITEQVNRPTKWSDVLVERLRSGRGSAIQGQKRGRALEDATEAVIARVFESYDKRCLFTGVQGRMAKCDFAVPEKSRPRILIETKGYGATGSKMSDIIGDLDAIIEVKRNDATLVLVTDGLAWKLRLSDLRKIVDRQNDGKIARIYTTNMQTQFESDLVTLKSEYAL